MSATNLKLEYREYKLPGDFPLLVMTPQISTAPAWVEEPKLHFHNCMEIGLMHGGNHSLSFENHTYSLLPGDFFVLSPYSMHYVNHTDGTKSHCCDYLYFNPEILLQAFYPVAVPEEMHWYQNSQVPFLFSREKNPEIYSLLLLILETHRQRNTSPHLKQNILQGLVLALMGNLTRAISSSASNNSNRSLSSPASNSSNRTLSSPASGSSNRSLSSPVPGNSNRALSSPASGSKYRSLSSLLPALHVLHTEYAKALTPAHLAKCCGLSLSAFRTSFTEQLGESPVLYLRDVRLKKACELLYSTELSVLEISMETGFSSLSYFYRCFQNCYHTSPGNWREANRAIQKKGIVHTSFTP